MRRLRTDRPRDARQALPGGPTPADMPWWMSPYRFTGLIVLPLAVVVVIGAASFQGSSASGYAVISYVTVELATLWFLGFLALILGSFVAFTQLRPPARADHTPLISLDVLFYCCLAGYAVWFSPILLFNPQVFLAAVRGEFNAVYEFRAQAPNISGITTLSQFGIAYALLYSDLRFRGNAKLPLRYTAYLAAVIVFAGIRALANSERLALIEVVLPVAFVMVAPKRPNYGLAFRIFRSAFPFIVVLSAPIFFVLFEYNRSWINLYQYKYQSFFEFGLERLAIYYSSAFNNMAGYLSFSEWPTFTGQNTLTWLYRFPIIGSLFQSGGDSQGPLSYQLFLELYASEEFNNSTGIMPAFADWGAVGGVIYFLMFGGVYGYSYLCFACRRGWMRHFYPLCLLSLFEILRVDYITDVRTVAVMIGLIVARLLEGAGAQSAASFRIARRASLG